MVKKTFSGLSSCSKDTFAASGARVMMNEHEQTTGSGERHPFLRSNAHLGSIPWTGSLRRTRPRRGNPQYLVCQHKDMVKQPWRVIPPDTKARRPAAKIAKNNPKHRTNPMPKYRSTRLHATSYLTRFLAKTCNKFKRTASHAYTTAKNTKLTASGMQCSAHPLLPCTPDEGLFLAPTRRKLTDTSTLHNNVPQHTNNHQTYQQTNNLSVDTELNTPVPSEPTPTPSLPAMADGQITNAPAPHPAHTGMSTLQYQDPSPERPETPNQEATPRPAAIASLVAWKRGYALKIVVGTVLKNVALCHKHTAFKKWKHYTGSKLQRPT